MLLDGFNHVAILTNDSERLHAFYEEVFDATVRRESLAAQAGPVRLTLITSVRTRS
jgi:predicted enzyme related to lactoylglutathione lyase